ncbi:MAG: MarR family winged helix-turn-helix transcriptional regulator [Actinomycetota bacterium]|nr:MarR family transcriptional regulator [Actinomycetota bacterium]
MALTRERTDTELASRLRLAVMRLARRLRQQTADPVTPSQISALATVEAKGPITLGDLAGLEQVQPPTMTRIVAALEQEGLVVREIDAGDRRIARVSVTPAGHRLLERSRGRKTAYLSHRLKSMSEEERELVERSLPLIERLIGDEER